MGQRYFFTFLIILLLNSCIFEQVMDVIPLRDIKFINNSDSDVYYLFAKNIPMDTTLYSTFPFDTLSNHLITKNSYLMVHPYEYKKVDPLGIKSSFGHIYFFSRYVIENVPWDTIRNKYLILKRYDIHIEDINNRNWTVKYP